MADILDIVSQISGLITVEQVLEFMGYDYSTHRGTMVQYRCPFHSDSSPSFYVNTQNNVFNCFGCNRKGTPYKLAKEYLMFSQLDERYVTVKNVLDYLSQIDSRIGQLVYEVHKPLVIDTFKKKNFMDLVKHEKSKVLKIDTPAKKKYYITGIMKNISDDMMVKYIELTTSNDVDNINLEDDLFDRLIRGD